MPWVQQLWRRLKFFSQEVVIAPHSLYISYDADKEKIFAVVFII